MYLRAYCWRHLVLRLGSYSKFSIWNWIWETLHDEASVGGGKVNSNSVRSHSKTCFPYHQFIMLGELSPSSWKPISVKIMILTHARIDTHNNGVMWQGRVSFMPENWPDRLKVIGLLSYLLSSMAIGLLSYSRVCMPFFLVMTSHTVSRILRSMPEVPLLLSNSWLTYILKARIVQ